MNFNGGFSESTLVISQPSQIRSACIKLCPLCLGKAEGHDLWPLLNDTWQDSSTGFGWVRIQTYLKKKIQCNEKNIKQKKMQPYVKKCFFSFWGKRQFETGEQIHSVEMSRQPAGILNYFDISSILWQAQQDFVATLWRCWAYQTPPTDPVDLLQPSGWTTMEDKENSPTIEAS